MATKVNIILGPGRDNGVHLSVESADSPKNGLVSLGDEAELSFYFASLDPKR